MPGSDKHRWVVRNGGFQWPRGRQKSGPGLKRSGPTRGVKIPLEYVGRDSVALLGDVVLLKGWSGSEVPLYNVYVWKCVKLTFNGQFPRVVWFFQPTAASEYIADFCLFVRHRNLKIRMPQISIVSNLPWSHGTISIRIGNESLACHNLRQRYGKKVIKLTVRRCQSSGLLLVPPELSWPTTIPSKIPMSSG